MDDTPNFVLVFVVMLIIMGVGIFIITSFISGAGLSSTSTESFGVSDPTVDFHGTLKYIPSATPTVTQFNGIEWLPVDSTYVTYLGKELIVAAGGMQG